MTAINESARQEIIGINSLHGWTRSQCIEEYNQIREAAKKGGLSWREWDNMESTLAVLYVSTDDDRFAMLVNLFHTGNFQDLRRADMFK